MASVTFPTNLGGSGATISDDADPNTGLAAGGHRTRFIPALSGAVDMAETSVAKAQAAENFKNLCQQLRDDAEAFKNQAATSETNAANSAALSEDWATSAVEVSGGFKGSRGYAEDAAQSAANLNAQDIVHAPNSGLPNEAGTAASRDVGESAGQLMEVGALGTGFDATPTSADLDSETTAGSFWSWRSDSTLNYPATIGTSRGGGITLGGVNSNRQMQIAFGNEGFFEGEIAFRVNRADVWQSWRPIYSSTNILGTVSQSGGVPTGAIIERGSNANGEYTKFADGTLECWVKEFATITTGVTPWTFPVSVVNSAKSSIQITKIGNSFVIPERSGGLNNNVQVALRNSTGNYIAGIVDIYLKGRWY